MGKIDDNKVTPMDLTGEQRKAVEHFGSNVFVNAGAGSGKTRILVARYVEILKRGLADIGEIVAITFTRKAAKEMKERIRKSLSSGDFPSELRYELEAAPISTIHTFCSRILRENAAQVHIDPDFRVLEEVEEVIFREGAIQDALVEAIHRGQKGAIKLIGEFGLESLIGIFRVLYLNRGRMERWLDYYAGRTESPPSDGVLPELTKMRLEMTLNDPEVQRSVVELSKVRSRDENDRIEKIRREVLLLIKALRHHHGEDEALSVLEKFKEINLSGGRPSSWDGQDLQLVKDTIKGLREVFKIVGEEVSPLSEDREKALDDMLRLLILGYTSMEEKLEERKRMENLLDYDDLMIITRRALRDNPELRNHLRQKYRFFLVDEFQDTDRQQWEILCNISSEDGRLDGDNLFLVGDFGQSIYRFRGAEVKIFSDVEDKIRREGGKSFPLTMNFRSTPALITFVNYLQGKVQVAWNHVAREPERIFLQGNRKKDTCRTPVEILVVTGEGGVDKGTCRRKEAGLLAGRIKEIIDKESRDYGQVAVLFRSMTYVWIYETAFRREGVPYILIKGGKFFGLQEIRDVMNALKAIEDNGDEVALAGLLRSPLFGVSDDTIYRLCAGSRLRDGLSMWREKDAVSPEEGSLLDGAIDFLKEAKARKDASGIYELISWMLERTAFQEVLLGTYGGERKVLNVNKLLQLALSFESKGLFTLNDFIRYIDRVSVQELYESEAPVELEDKNVVKVMTVHSAKGLEFPVVVLPDLIWYKKRELPLIVHHPRYGFAIRGDDEGRKGEKPRRYKAVSFVNRTEEMMESGRLFYVATTRARDKLVLSASIPQSMDEKRMSSSWVRWIWDLLPENVRRGTTGEDESDLGEEVRSLYEVASTVCEIEKGSEEKGEYDAPVGYGDVAGASLELPPDILSRIDPIEPAGSSEELSVSQILDYLECPKRFYLRHVLKLPGLRHLSSGRFSRASSVSIGELVHLVLQKWDFPSNEDLMHLIGTQSAGMGEGAGREVQERVISLLTRFRGSELLRDIIDADGRKRLFRELGFTILVQGVLVRGSMDVVFQGRDGGWIIVDYKTTEANEGDSIGSMRRYEQQVMIYAIAFGKITGESPKKGIIYFLPTGYAPEVPIAGMHEFNGLIQTAIADLKSGQYFENTSCCGDCDLQVTCRFVSN